MAAANPCTALNGLEVKAREIALPSKGAIVQSAKQIGVCELFGIARCIGALSGLIRSRRPPACEFLIDRLPALGCL
jgi:hypothetical protein